MKQKFYKIISLFFTVPLIAHSHRSNFDLLKADLREIKECVGLSLATPALDSFISEELAVDLALIQAALQDAVVCLAAAKDTLSDEQIIAYSEKIESYWAAVADMRAPRPPFIDPTEGQLAPSDLTYFPRDVFIARNLEVGGDFTVSGNTLIEGGFEIEGDLTVNGNGIVTDDFEIGGDLVVDGNATVVGDLTVTGTVTFDASTISFIDTTNAATFNCLDFKKSRNGAIVQNGDTVGCLNFQGFDGAAFVSAASVEARVDGTPGLADMPGRIVFLTSPDGSASPTEKMRITNAGVVSLTNNLDIPNTTSATTGVITKNGNRFIHTGGANNTFLGVNAGNFSASGSNNTGIGLNALTALTTGDSNTACGTSALINLTQGQRNVAVGLFAGFNISTGDANVAVGERALLSTDLGGGNVAIGTSALEDVGVGNTNVAVGFGTGGARTSMGNCTLLGAFAETTADGFFNATALGAGARVDAGNKVRIGNTSVTVIEGEVAFTASSDERIKHDIEESPFGFEFIRRIKPLRYKKECGENLVEELGFSAQNVEAVAHELGLEFPGLSHSSSDDRYYLRYNDFIPAIVKALQEAILTIESLKERIEALESEQ
jgi:hypothetical protein